jgi:nucleotide-binding universal stress UspA family protein
MTKNAARKTASGIRSGKRAKRETRRSPHGGVYRRILVPLDGSKASFAALRSAIRLAKQLDATLVAYHALAPVPVPHFDAPPAGYPTPKEYRALMRALAKRLFEKAERMASLAGVGLETTSDARDAVADGIALAARRMGCDLILLGSHGRGAFGRLLLGSVATRLISTAETPVLVLPERAIRHGLPRGTKRR